MAEAGEPARPLYVGLTGSVAAGKSSVGRRLEALGAVRIDADDLARDAVRRGTPAFERIVSAWGPGVLDETGTLDRAALRAVAFADPEARRRLETIVHADVARLRAERRAAIEASPPASGIVVEEIPLLFEAGLENGFARIVVVDAPVEVRAARARATRGWDRDAFDAIERSQLPPVEKRARADVVIENDDTIEALERRVDDVWSGLVSLAASARGSRGVDAEGSRA